MIESSDPTELNKPFVRCAECDREVEYYNTFLSPTNEPKNVCWECLQREEKGFNADRHFSRQSRSGIIPR